MTEDDTQEERQAAPGPAAQRLRCFVIGPIGNRLADHGSEQRTIYEEALEVWTEVIEPACKAAELTPVRADGLARATMSGCARIGCARSIRPPRTLNELDGKCWCPDGLCGIQRIEHRDGRHPMAVDSGET